MTADSSPITIRVAYADDQTALADLAALDSADQVPPMPILLAEVDGQLRAALSLRNDSVVADPFHPTVDLVALLRARSGATSTRRRAPKLRYRLGYA